MHLLFVLYAGAVFLSKLASTQEFLSSNFILLFGAILVSLMVYAFFWQKVLKIFPLSFAYSNRSAVILWTMLLGVLVFGEEITVGKLVGAAIIIAGVLLMVKDYE